ncbi:MAG TPA: glycosyltransferase family 4 protein [Gammaproteobacteria bacterium]|nr:glycosyltransferase family 4 protein [Gammaproteobacteria bacterium]
MRIWMPHLVVGSGADVFTNRLATGLASRGHKVVRTTYSRFWQYFPWGIRLGRSPAAVDCTIAGGALGPGIKNAGGRLVLVEHHCVNDPAYGPYRSWAQAAYHEALVRRFTAKGVKKADMVVCVSQYTARILKMVHPRASIRVILNGVETDFFYPRPGAPERGQPFRLLFVGNLTRRKGADLLPRIMQALGPDFLLGYTCGLTARDPFSRVPNMVALGRLTQEGLRDAYRDADVLLYPTRYEGFGYAVVESMACGTPAVATSCSSLPELIEHDVNGKLCPIDDIDAFVTAVRDLAADTDRLMIMGQHARATAEKRFDLSRTVSDYENLLFELTSA